MTAHGYQHCAGGSVRSPTVIAPPATCTSRVRGKHPKLLIIRISFLISTSLSRSLSLLSLSGLLGLGIAWLNVPAVKIRFLVETDLRRILTISLLHSTPWLVQPLGTRGCGSESHTGLEE